MGFERDQLEEHNQNEEALLEEMEEKDHSKELEDKASIDDADVVHHPLVRDMSDDI